MYSISLHAVLVGKLCIAVRLCASLHICMISFVYLMCILYANILQDVSIWACHFSVTICEVPVNIVKLKTFAWCNKYVELQNCHVWRVCVFDAVLCLDATSFWCTTVLILTGSGLNRLGVEWRFGALKNRQGGIGDPQAPFQSRQLMYYTRW